MKKQRNNFVRKNRNHGHLGNLKMIAMPQIKTKNKTKFNNNQPQLMKKENEQQTLNKQSTNSELHTSSSYPL